MPTIPLTIVPEPDDPDGRLAFVDGSVDGVATRFLLDTGAARSTIFAADHPDLPVVDHRGGRGASGAFVAGDRVRVGRIELGPIVAENLVVDREPDPARAPFPLLGMDVLAGHRLLLSPATGRLDVDEPVPAGARLLELFRHPGGQPAAELRVGGTTARVCLDTGASVTIVHRPFALDHPELIGRNPASVRLPIVGQASTGTDVTGATMPGTSARLAPCRIGGVDLPASPCALVDLSVLNEALPEQMDAIVGLPLLMAADWLFDLPRAAWAVLPR